MKRITLFIIITVAALATACGGGSGSSGPQLVRETVIAQDSFEYDPASISVPEGSSVTIELVNEGSLEHSWVLMSNDINPEEATDEDALNDINSGKVAGGESTRFSFEAPPPGSYQFVCTIPGHAIGGMVGSFTVEASE